MTIAGQNSGVGKCVDRWRGIAPAEIHYRIMAHASSQRDVEAWLEVILGQHNKTNTRFVADTYRSIMALRAPACVNALRKWNRNDFVRSPLEDNDEALRCFETCRAGWEFFSRFAPDTPVCATFLRGMLQHYNEKFTLEEQVHVSRCIDRLQANWSRKEQSLSLPMEFAQEPPSVLKEFGHLKDLHLSGCYCLTSLDHIMPALSDLAVLKIDSASILESLPSSINRLNLTTLNLSGLRNMKNLGPDLRDMGSLKNVKLTFDSPNVDRELFERHLPEHAEVHISYGPKMTATWGKDF